ncbi:MAG: type II secretion system GspH family protein [Gammaproteobacteria bacterium]|nr:type II secretion system GspH family protein [Gammaproteobacteria bacterium]
MPASHSQSGFTLLELAIALVILSLLIGISIAPLSSLIKNNKKIRDEIRLEKLSANLENYALSHGGLPDSEANNELVINTSFPVSVNEYGKHIKYYVPSILTVSSTGGDFTSFCTNLHGVISNPATVSDLPKICHDRTYAAGSCSVASNHSFLVVSTGADQQFFGENADTDSVFYTSDITPSVDNDDVLKSVNLFALAKRCGHVF